MRPERLTGPNLLALVGDQNGPALWRVLQPFSALERRGYACGWDSIGNPALTDGFAARFDGLIIARMSWPAAFRDRARRWFDLARARRQLVVFETDDDILTTAMTRHALGSGLGHGKTLHQLEEERHDTLWAMRQCDGVTVSTETLAARVRAYTDKPVIVVPNAIDLPWFRSVVRRAQTRSGLCPPSAHVTIGWVGGQRDEADLSAVADAWRRIACRYPSVRFVVAGHRSARLTAAVPPDRLTFRPWVPIERYPESFAGIDIGVAAVAPSLFNAAKSEIKAYEYAVAGAAVIASPSLYGAIVEHGKTGYLAETADEWTTALVDLLERPAHRAIFARRLLRVVERDHTLSANLYRWPEAWRSIAASAEVPYGRVVMA